jgi:putative cardiolipin synthase
MKSLVFYSNLFSLLVASLILTAAPLQAFDDRLNEYSGLPKKDVAYPMRLQPTPEEEKETPFKYSKRLYNWLEDKVSIPISENLDPRMQSLLQSRQYKSWFHYQDSILKDLDVDTKPAPVKIQPIYTPQEGLLAKLALIDNAKFTIDVSYYIFKKDETGYAFLEALKRAIDRGVNVRIVVDSIGSLGVYHSELKALKHHAYQLRKNKSDKGLIRDESGRKTDQYAQVEALVFNPLYKPGQITRYLARKVSAFYRKVIGSDVEVPQIKSWYNRRTHDKILLVDGRFPGLAKAIFGGRNISNSYYAIPKLDSDTYMDQEVIVANNPYMALVSEEMDFGTIVSNWYDKLYMFQGNNYLYVGLKSMFGYDSEYESMAQSYDYIDKVTKESQIALGIDISKSGFGKKYLNSGWMEATSDLVYSIHNLYRRNASSEQEIEENARNHDALADANGIVRTIRKHIWNEDERVAIISPYLWLSNEEMANLKVWLDEKPERRLDIYTNSVLTSDNMLAQTLVDQALGPVLLGDGKYSDRIRIFQYGRADAIELGGKGVYGKLHQKGVLFYGQNLVFEGTNNKDPRSQYLNSEVGVVLKSAEYVEKKMIPRIQKLERESHQWNSEEYHEIRSNQLLPSIKRKSVEKQKEVYDFLIESNLWWLI